MPTRATANDGYVARRNALDRQIPYFTTLAGAEAALEAIEFLKDGELTVRAASGVPAPRRPPGAVRNPVGPGLRRRAATTETWGAYPPAPRPAASLAARGETPRGTESGQAPGWQGATRENIGHIRPRSNAVQPGCLAARMQRGFHHGLPGETAGAILPAHRNSPQPLIVTHPYHVTSTNPADCRKALELRLDVLKGIGPVSASQLAGRGLATVEDLLYHRCATRTDATWLPSPRLPPGTAAASSVA